LLLLCCAHALFSQLVTQLVSKQCRVRSHCSHESPFFLFFSHHSTTSFFFLLFLIHSKANNDEEFGYDDDDDNIAGTENKGFTKSLIAPEGDFENSDFILEETAAVETKQCHREFKMISLHSTAGRPAFDDLVETSYAEQYDTTAIYLCGPEQMISSCKKAAGMGCQFAAERIQMALKKNKFVFYEEKFEW